MLLLGAFVCARELQREHVLRAIASGHEHLPLDEVTRETQRLASPRHAAQQATRLERALDHARRWHEIPVASRPPQGVRQLRSFSIEIEEIIARLRNGRAPLRGLALLELLLIGSYDFALYNGDERELRQQLWHIRYMLTHP